jgi:hypothetical protein
VAGLGGRSKRQDRQGGSHKKNASGGHGASVCGWVALVGFLTARIATWNVNSVKQRPAFGDID